MTTTYSCGCKVEYDDKSLKVIETTYCPTHKPTEKLPTLNAGAAENVRMRDGVR